MVRQCPFLILTPDEIVSLTFDFTATVDDLIDVIMKDHRKYIRWLVSMFRERGRGKAEEKKTEN